MPAAQPNLLGHVVNYYQEELYDDVAELACFVETMTEQDARLLLTAQRQQLYFYWGSALMHLQQYERAEAQLMKALNLKNANFRPRTRSSPVRAEQYTEPVDEAELRYRLYTCIIRQTDSQQRLQDAVKMLSEVPDTAKRPKHLAALAHLHTQLGSLNSCKDLRPAVSNQMLLLGRAPLAMHALRQLFALPLQADEMKRASSAVFASIKAHEAFEDVKSIKWFTDYFKSLCCRNPSVRDADVAAIKQVDNIIAKHLPCNAILLRQLAMLHDTRGDYERAIEALRRAHIVEPLNPQCMDTLALRLHNMQTIEATRELDALCADLIEQRTDCVEKYTACAYMALGETKTTNRALYLAQKAVLTAQSTLCERRACANAYLVKARVLIALDNRADALSHLHEAINVDPELYDAYALIVEQKLRETRYDDALHYARLCRHRLGAERARPLMLYARVLAQQDSSVPEAIKALEKATAYCPAPLEAVLDLIELYDRPQVRQYEKAITLLRREAQAQGNSRLQQMLANFLVKTNKSLEAVNVYAGALRSADDEKQLGITAFDIIAPILGASPDVEMSTSNADFNAPAVAISAESSSSFDAVEAASARTADVTQSHMTRLRRRGASLMSAIRATSVSAANPSSFVTPAQNVAHRPPQRADASSSSRGDTSSNLSFVPLQPALNTDSLTSVRPTRRRHARLMHFASGAEMPAFITPPSVGGTGVRRLEFSDSDSSDDE